MMEKALRGMFDLGVPVRSALHAIDARRLVSCRGWFLFRGHSDALASAAPIPKALASAGL